MTIKPFAIQGADLTLGGVNLQAGTTGVVIPGVTQATSYLVEEVNENGANQEITFNSTPIVIDSVVRAEYNDTGASTGRAEYSVALDGNGYIDEIEVVSPGLYSQQKYNEIMSDTSLYAYTGVEVDPFATFVRDDWTSLPFVVKMRAGEVENVGGGIANLGNITVENDNTFTIDDDTLGLRSFNPYGSEAKIEVDAYRIRSQVVLPNTRTYSVADGFDSAQWVAGEGSTITFTNLQQYVTDFLNIGLGPAIDITVQINGTGSEYSYSYFNGIDQIYIATNPATSPVTVTEIRFSYNLTSYVNIDPDEGDLGIVGAPGVDIRITAGDDIFVLANDEIRVTAGDRIQLRSGDDYVRITTNYDINNATPHYWTFGTDGTLEATDGGKFKASVITDNEYSVEITPDGINTVWGGQDTWSTGAGPQGGVINAKANKSIAISTDDGAKSWTFGTDGTITFPDGSIQTTAHIDSTSDIWIAGGEGAGDRSVVHYSTDGVAWTTTDIGPNDTAIERVAIGAGKIVYLINRLNDTAIYYANSPTDAPTLAVGTDSYETAPLRWREVNYLGGQFVAVGSVRSTSTVTANIVSVTLAEGARTAARVSLDNTSFDFAYTDVTISGAANTELNGTFNLRYNELDTVQTGVYELYDINLGTPVTITSTDATGASLITVNTSNFSLPIFAYSANGVTWTYGDFDPGYFMFVLGPYAQATIGDVAYNGTGYLLPVTNDTFNIPGGADPTAAGPGAFYLTDLTVTAGGEQFIPGTLSEFGLPGVFNNIATYGDGTFFVCDDRYTLWTGTPGSPWIPHDIKSALTVQLNWEPELALEVNVYSNNNNDIDSAVAGTVGGTEYWVGTTNEGNVVATSDNGDTFIISTPEPYVMLVEDIVRNGAPGQASILVVGGQGSLQHGMPVIISGVLSQNGNPSNYNGSYWVGRNTTNNNWEIYTNAGLTVFLDTSTFEPVVLNTGTATLNSGPDLGAIAIADGACIVYSNSSDKLYRSTDMTTWTVVLSDLGSYTINDIYYGTAAYTGNQTNTLINDTYSVTLNNNGSLTLPAGGTVSEGIVTSNPTIQLTPASPSVTSQKLVIKGGANYVFVDNGIELTYNNNIAQVGDTLTFNVYSNAYANQTLYWWISPGGAGIGDAESGTVVTENSGGQFSILIDSDDYEFTVRVSPENNIYDPLTLGVESGLINADAPTFDGDHHLHLTTGDLAVTSIFLGTDNHNVRTTVDGTIQVTTPNMGNNVWEFGTTGNLTLPNGAVIRKSTNAELTNSDSAYTDAIADWEYLRINDYLYSVDNIPGITIEGWPFAGWNDVSGTTADAYLAIVNNAWNIQQTPSSPPSTLIFQPAITSTMFNQIRSGLQLVIDTYATQQALLTSVDIVVGNETLSLLNNNKIQVPGIIQTDVEEDLIIRARYAFTASPSGTTTANKDFVFGTNGTLTFTGTNTYDSSIQGDASGNLNLTAGNYVNIEAFSNAAITLAKYVANTSVELGNSTSPVKLFGDLQIMSGRNITTTNASVSIVNTGATTVNFAGAATTLNIGAAGGTTTIAGDLTVNGTTTTINSTTLTVDDNNIELGSVASPTNTTADGGGISLKGATDKTFNWVNATGAWTSSEDLNLLTGKVYEINGVAVLSATALLNDASQTTVTIAGSATTALNIGASGAPITGFAATATTSSTASSLGYLGLPQSATATTASLAIGDAGKHIYVTTAGQTITIPANSSVAYPIGTTITFIAGASATTVSIAITTDTMRLAGGALTGTRTLAANGMATAVKVAATTWYINGTGLT